MRDWHVGVFLSFSPPASFSADSKPEPNAPKDVVKLFNGRASPA
jgi:hypothetical protein